MKKKINFFDKQLFNEFLYVLSTVGLIFSFFTIIIDVQDKAKILVGIALIIILVGIYIIMWIKANKLTSVELNIDNSKIIIKTGDLFEEQGYKVITFNEYFDTIVDNNIISEFSLNGIYLNNKVNNIEELDNLMNVNHTLKEKVVEKNQNRSRGKKEKYKLGTIFQNNDFLLTAFSKFDSENRAYLYMNDYINFLLNFWNEIDIVYAGRSVSIPLMGSGITRFKDYNHITDHELLELLLWSFKISRIKFTYPSTVTIIIHESRKDKINFFKLKEMI